MGFIERELERISGALRARQIGTDEYRQLYAAQQALGWALEPLGFRAPYDTILDIPTDALPKKQPQGT
jgi:hypothetical protein